MVQDESKKSQICKGKRPKVKSFKNQIRSMERMLKKAELSEEAREAIESKIKTLHDKRDEKKMLEKQKVEYLKYKKIRLFERRKLLRSREKLKKKVLEMKENSNEANEIQKELNQIEQDLDYVKNFPFGMKYVAILATNSKDPEAEKKIAHIRQLIKERKQQSTATLYVNSVEEIVKEEEQEQEKEEEFFLQQV